MNKFLLTPLLAAGLFFAGCATTYQVQVSALANPELSAVNRSYSFAVAQGQSPGDLQLLEVQRQVRAALDQQGFRETDRSSAGLNLFLDYGIGDPVTRTHTFSTPIYAELGGGYTTRTRQTTDATGKTTTTTESVRVPGRYERVGTDVTTNSITTYRKHLRLSARLSEPGIAPHQGREVWTVTAINDDQRADLRVAIPLLAKAIAPYVGSDSGHAVVVEFEEKAGRFVPVR